MKRSVLIAALAPFFAKDAKPEDISAAVDAQLALDKSAKDAKDKAAKDKAAKDKAAKDKAAKDASEEAAEDDGLGVGPEVTIVHNVTGDEDEVDGEDEDNVDPNEGKNTMDKKAMDARIKLAVDSALSRQAALHQARVDVEPIIGKVAYDSAEQVYKAALDKLEVDTAGVDASAYGSMLKLAVKGTQAPMAQDGAAGGQVKSMGEAFKHFNRIK